MIIKDEIQELLHSTETYRVERTTSTDERSKSRGQVRLDYALQGERRREPAGDMDKFQEAICAFANDLPNSRKNGYLLLGAYDNGGKNGGKVGGDVVDNVVENVVENKENVVELAAMCSLSERQVQRIMTKLKEQGVIRRIGPDKGGHWEKIAP